MTNRLLCWVIAVVFAVSTAGVTAAENQLRDGDTVAIIGDSITQARKYSVLMETQGIRTGNGLRMVRRGSVGTKPTRWQ